MSFIFVLSIYNGDGLPNNYYLMITEKEYLESVRIVNQYLLQQVELRNIPKVHIVDSNISVRLYNVLKNNGVNFLNELSTYQVSDLMKWRNFGKQTFNELEEVMEYHHIPKGW